MSENEPTNRLRDLDTRLRQIREEEREKTEQAEASPRGAMSGLGVAMRIGTELVGGLIAGLGIGYMLDRWLGTTPWLLVVFFFLGSAAGILNVYRSASRMEVDPSERRKGNEFSSGPQGNADGSDDGNQRRDG